MLMSITNLVLSQNIEILFRSQDTKCLLSKGTNCLIKEAQNYIVFSVTIPIFHYIQVVYLLLLTIVIPQYLSILSYLVSNPPDLTNYKEVCQTILFVIFPPSHSYVMHFKNLYLDLKLRKLPNDKDLVKAKEALKRSIYHQVKLEDPRIRNKFPEADVDIRISLPRLFRVASADSKYTDPVVNLERNLYGHPLARLW